MTVLYRAVKIEIVLVFDGKMCYSDNIKRNQPPTKWLTSQLLINKSACDGQETRQAYLFALIVPIIQIGK